jgi:hypothetical protein
MASSGNKEWAFTEAKRRAIALGNSYYVYAHRRNIGDHIIKPTSDKPPSMSDWRSIALVTKDSEL